MPTLSLTAAPLPPAYLTAVYLALPHPCLLIPCPAARSPELSKDLVKLRIHLRNKFHRQITQWRGEQGAKADGEMRSIQELVSHQCAVPAVMRVPDCFG